MINVILYTLVSVAIISLVSLISIYAFVLSEKLLKRLLLYMVSFSTGALLGGALFHLLPEIITEHGFTFIISIYIIIGILFSFIIEKFIHWHHCHKTDHTQHHIHSFAYMNLFGDGVHNFIDGLIIAASYLISIPVGIAATIAVVLHEIPQEIGDFSVLLHGGFTKKKALLLNFLTALTSLIGAGIALIIGTYTDHLTLFLIPFAAGSFIYIAAADLIPELHKETDTKKSFLQLMMLVLGITISGLFVFLPI